MRATNWSRQYCEYQCMKTEPLIWLASNCSRSNKWLRRHFLMRIENKFEFAKLFFKESHKILKNRVFKSKKKSTKINGKKLLLENPFALEIHDYLIPSGWSDRTPQYLCTLQHFYYTFDRILVEESLKLVISSADYVYTFANRTFYTHIKGVNFHLCKFIRFIFQ